jgi:hypothetical protein
MRPKTTMSPNGNGSLEDYNRSRVGKFRVRASSSNEPGIYAIVGDGRQGLYRSAGLHS